MISSLPKTLQNDFDVIVIDLLTRYSIDNKSVQKFVQTVAQQVRDINRIPRSLRLAKKSDSRPITENKAEDKTANNNEKPSFITRLENLQTTFNKGGLLGVLFEHLKNKQDDTKAKIAPDKNTISQNNDETTSSESQEFKIKEDQKTLPEPQEFKLAQQDTKILEKTVTSSEKLQEAFDSKGLVNIVQDIFDLLKKRPTETSNTITKQKKNETQLSAVSLTNKPPEETVSNLVTSAVKETEKTIPNSVSSTIKKLEETVPNIISSTIKNLGETVPNIAPTTIKGSEETNPNIVTSTIKDLEKTISNIVTSTIKGSKETNPNIVTSTIKGSKETNPNIVTSTIKGTKEIINPTTTKNYNTDTQTNKTDVLTINPQNTNYSTVNTSTAQTTGDTSLNTTNLTVAGSQAQAENLLPDEIDVVLGGVNDQGETDLKRIFKSVFEDIMPKEKTGVSVEKEKEEVAASGGDSGGLLDLLGKGSLMSRALGGAKSLVTGAARGIGSLGSKLLTLGRMPAGVGAGTGGALATGGAVLGGLAIGGTAGTALAKNEAFSEWAYGSKEAGKKAMEEYDTGPLGLMAIPQLFHASYDAMKAIGEAKKARKRADEMEKKTIPLDVKAMILGYKDLGDFGKAVGEGKEKRHMMWDDQKQAVITIMPDGTQEIHKFIYGKGFQGKPEIVGPDGKKVSDKSQPPNIQPPSAIKPPIESTAATPLTPETTKISEPATPLTPETTKISEPATPLTPEITKVAEPATTLTPEITKISEPATPLTPETTKITPPVPSSITENHITNNNADKKALSDIAGNTERTNKSLATLGDAVFKLAKVFDAKTMGGGNSILINSNGKTQQYTSTGQMAANNQDSIRVVRQQFLAAT